MYIEENYLNRKEIERHVRQIYADMLLTGKIERIEWLLTNIKIDVKKIEDNERWKLNDYSKFFAYLAREGCNEFIRYKSLEYKENWMKYGIKKWKLKQTIEQIVH